MQCRQRTAILLLQLQTIKHRKRETWNVLPQPYKDLFLQLIKGSSVAEWLTCWTRAQKARVQIAVAMLSGNSLRQTVHTHCASVHQAVKLVAALIRVARVTAGLAGSNGSLPPGLWLTSPAGWLPRTRISSRTLRSAIEYGLPLPLQLTAAQVGMFT